MEVYGIIDHRIVTPHCSIQMEWRDGSPYYWILVTLLNRDESIRHIRRIPGSRSSTRASVLCGRIQSEYVARWVTIRGYRTIRLYHRSRFKLGVLQKPVLS